MFIRSYYYYYVVGWESTVVLLTSSMNWRESVFWMSLWSWWCVGEWRGGAAGAGAICEDVLMRRRRWQEHRSLQDFILPLLKVSLWCWLAGAPAAVVIVIVASQERISLWQQGIYKLQKLFWNKVVCPKAAHCSYQDSLTHTYIPSYTHFTTEQWLQGDSVRCSKEGSTLE